MENFTRRRRLLAAVTALCIAPVFSGPVRAADLQNHDLRIVVADDSESTKRIVEGLQKKFPTASVLTDLTENPSKKKTAIYIAVGPSALRSLLVKDVDGIAISLFTSSQAYKAILDSVPKPRSLAVTAIYAEPSPFDQMQLISGLYRKRINVAVLISDKTAYLQPLLSRAATQQGITLSVERVDAADNLNRVLNRVEHASVILAIPDNSIYNVENIRNILITAYRRNQAVVGFSTALVKAGALASTFSDIDDILLQVGELIDDYAGSGRLPEPQFPRYFNVVVNDSVARSLNLVIDDNVRRLSRKPSERQQ